MIKLAIVGSRYYTDYTAFKAIVDNHITEIGQVVEIMSGGASGVDTLAEQYATKHNIPIKIFHADWNKGDMAGPIRNTTIIENATHVLALPCVKSVGTYDSIRKAKKMGRQLKVIKV